MNRTQNLPSVACLLILIVGLGLFSGCYTPDKKDVVTVTSRSMEKERAAFSGIPDELASLGTGSHGFNYWVRGSVRNTSFRDIRGVVLVFQALDGSERRPLIAEIDFIEARGSATFATRVLPSSKTLVLLSEEPEVTFQWGRE